MQVSKIEKEIGIEVYATKTHGIGGVIRILPEDFVVEEVLVDGSHAKIMTPETSQISKRGRYLRCILIKRKWDTLRAVEEICRHLYVSQERIQIAGIKDKNAVTAQHISISRLTPEQLQKIKIADISILPKNYSNEVLSPSSLLGNIFQITIKSIRHSISAIQKRTQETYEELLTLGGMPNFFGHQRFGTIRSITHKVGKALILGNLEEAALVFLAQPSKHEHFASKEARQRLRNEQNWEEAVEYFPRNLHYERLMLHHLSRHRHDFAGAFRRLPMKLRKLFIQAYQSYLFNKCLSERLKEHISLDEPQIGDYAVQIDGQGLLTGESSQVTSTEDSKEDSRKRKIRLAIPLTGFKQSFSSGVQGEIERRIHDAENVSTQDFLVTCIPELRAAGGLRPILAQIKGFSIRDLSNDSASISKRKATLEFMLHKGSYATVLLREFMKVRNLIASGF